MYTWVHRDVAESVQRFEKFIAQSSRQPWWADLKECTDKAKGSATVENFKIVRLDLKTGVAEVIAEDAESYRKIRNALMRRIRSAKADLKKAEIELEKSKDPNLPADEREHYDMMARWHDGRWFEHALELRQAELDKLLKSFEKYKRTKYAGPAFGGGPGWMSR